MADRDYLSKLASMSYPRAFGQALEDIFRLPDRAIGAGVKGVLKGGEKLGTPVYKGAQKVSPYFTGTPSLTPEQLRGVTGTGPAFTRTPEGAKARREHRASLEVPEVSPEEAAMEEMATSRPTGNPRSWRDDQIMSDPFTYLTYIDAMTAGVPDKFANVIRAGAVKKLIGIDESLTKVVHPWYHEKKFPALEMEQALTKSGILGDNEMARQMFRKAFQAGELEPLPEKYLVDGVPTKKALERYEGGIFLTKWGIFGAGHRGLWTRMWSKERAQPGPYDLTQTGGGLQMGGPSGLGVAPPTLKSQIVGELTAEGFGN